MFQIFPCPSCSATAVLRREVAEHESLECPSCGVSTSLAQVAAAYASWSVAGESESHNNDTPLRLAEETPPKSGEPGDTKSGSPGEAAAKKAAWQGFEPVTHEQFERMKRKQRSPIWSMLQIVLGGAAAFPIALLILWYGLGKDVMEAGPTLARYVPWLVPERFHPVDMSDLGDSPPSSLRRADDSSLSDAAERLALDVAGGSVGNTSTNSDAKPPTGLEQSVSPGQPDQGEMLGTSRDSVNELTRKAIAQQYPFTQGLFNAISLSESDLIAWQQSHDDPDADLRALAQQLYGRMLSIAKQLELFPGESPAFRFVRDEMQSNSVRVKRRSDLQSLIQQGAASRMVDGVGETPLAMILQIREVTREPDSWKIVAEALPPLELSGNLEVRVPRYLSPILIENQRIFVLGMFRDGSQVASVADENASVFVANYLHSFSSQAPVSAE